MTDQTDENDQIDDIDDEVFPFDAVVAFKRSGEKGSVVAMAFYKRQIQPQYLVEYAAADGRATERWAYEDELELISVPPAESDLTN